MKFFEAAFAWFDLRKENIKFKQFTDELASTRNSRSKKKLPSQNTMSDREALEDLRSKIIASMKPNNTQQDSEKRFVAVSDNDSPSSKRLRTTELPKGPRTATETGTMSSGSFNMGRNQSRYGGVARADNRRPQSRFNPYERSYSRGTTGTNNYASQNTYQDHKNYGSSYGSFKRFGDKNLQDVTPIDQRKRMAPTRWDVTPKGFEKVPAERAKLSGLFPQPGQPQKLDHYKLERVAMHGGTKSRRTRILFDDPTSNNLTIARMGCILIISNVDKANNNFGDLENFLKRFITSLSGDYEVKKFYQGPDFEAVEFNSPECTTLVLACRSYINKEVKLENLKWKRPNEYVQQLDHPDRLCGPDMIALENLPCSSDSIENFLNENQVSFNFCQPVTEKGNGSDSFTNCALVEISKPDEEKLSELKVPWFRPNSGKLIQTAASITYQTLPNLVQEKKRSRSKVVMLLNCVDPLDLKHPELCEEIEQTLNDTLHEVETIWIKKPNVNYRLNFENIGEGVGRIYIRFKTADASEKAMNDLPGRKFNGRTVLCSYFDEEDFELVRNI